VRRAPAGNNHRTPTWLLDYLPSKEVSWGDKSLKDNLPEYGDHNQRKSAVD
jgi:hypothetical protein